MDDLDVVLARRSGVVSRRQLLAAGLAAHDIRRLLRRRDLVVVLPGVYVDHTGEPTRLQSSWAAVLALWPAALCHETALNLADGRAREARPWPLHVAVDRDRSPSAPSGVRLHRLTGLDSRVLWNLCPPRVRIEEALIDVAAECSDDLEAIATLADAVQSRRTTPARLRAALAGRRRVAGRGFLDGVLSDLEEGSCSVLEHGYLTLVERAHGLPQGDRQVAESDRGSVYRDVLYRQAMLVVELDGKLFHDTALDRDRDLERDLEVAVSGRLTVRLGWGQVFGRPCHTAGRISELLRRRGWSGAARRCRDCRRP